MTTKKLLTAVTLLCLSLSTAWAQGPNGSEQYYKAADGKKGAALKTALCGIIYSRKERSYNQLWEDFKKTDKRSDGKVWDMYSGITNYTFGTDQAGSYTEEGDVYNREHSFPKSWFGGKESSVPGHDLFHIYPTDGFVNGKRSNYPFGENNGEEYSSSGNFSKLGKCTYPGCTYIGDKKYVFEPNDEYKGDFARTYFYMVTCYEEQLSSWYSNYANNNEGLKATIDGSTYPAFTTWQLNMLLDWSRKDPVSEKEINRNNAVYDLQQNRNPFIDYPGLEEYIWGTKTSESFDYTMGGSGETPTTVSTPYFSLAGGTYTTAQTVTISCATSGATIYYTTDGTPPSASSTKYDAAITIRETTTLKAIAVKDGKSSSVAEATYTINTGGGDEPTPVTGDGIFEKVTSTSELESGKRYVIVSETHSLTKFDGTKGTGTVTVNNSKIDMNKTSNTALIVTMEKVGSYWTVKGEDKYMALTSDNNALNSVESATANTAKWTISVTSGTASISNVNYTKRYLKYNTSADLFRCYTTGQKDIALYKEVVTEPEVLLGDVNNDGAVTIADVTALVNILLGKDTSYNLDAADVNSDDKTTIADVTELVNILLKK